MSLKENFGKAVEYGKKNPIIVLILFVAIVWVLMRRSVGRPGLEPLPALPGAGRITGQAFPQIGAVERREREGHVVERPEELEATRDIVDRDDVFFLPPRGRGVLDYDVVGTRIYREAIAAAHAAWQPGRPDRIVDARGRILTAERGFEAPEDVIARQRVRFDRAIARRDRAAADMVRRETELATGMRVGW